MTEPVDPGSVRIGDAAQTLGITEDHLRRLCNQGIVPCDATPGGHRLFDPRALAEIRALGVEEYQRQLRQRTSTIPNSQGEIASFETAEQGLLLHKKVKRTAASSFALMDTGEQILSCWHFPQKAGCRLPQLPKAGHFTMHMPAVSKGKILGITVVVDPLLPDPRWSDEMLMCAKQSYAACYASLLAGALTIATAPFATVIPVDRLRLLSPLGGDEKSILSQQVDLLPGPLPEEAQQEIPPAAEWSVFLDVPTRSLRGEPYFDKTFEGGSFCWVWSGLVQILHQEETFLGNLGPVAP